MEFTNEQLNSFCKEFRNYNIHVDALVKGKTLEVKLLKLSKEKLSLDNNIIEES